jgi:hypothetical protein
MQMKVFPLAVVLLVIILFSVDPNTSLVADRIYEPNYRDDVVSDNKDNKKDNFYNKVHNGEHLCLKCNSHSLTLQPSEINREGGYVLQSIECQYCGYQWQEIWTLPSWSWSEKYEYYLW